MNSNNAPVIQLQDGTFKVAVHHIRNSVWLQIGVLRLPVGENEYLCVEQAEALIRLLQRGVARARAIERLNAEEQA